MPNPTPQKLRAEIDADPAGLGLADRFAAGDDGGLLAAMHEPRYPGRRSVPVSDILTVARTRGLTPRIRQFAGVVPHLAPPDGVPQAAQLAALAAVDLFMSADQPVDLDLPAVTTTLDGLEQATLLTTYGADGSVLIDGPTNRAAIVALGDTLLSRTEVLWGAGTVITPDLIHAARSIGATP